MATATATKAKTKTSAKPKPLRPKFVIDSDTLAALVFVQDQMNLKTLGQVGLQAFMAGAYRISSDRTIKPLEVPQLRADYSDIPELGEDETNDLGPNTPTELMLSMSLNQTQQNVLEWLRSQLGDNDSETPIAVALRHGIEIGLPFLYALPHVGLPDPDYIEAVKVEIQESIDSKERRKTSEAK